MQRISAAVSTAMAIVWLGVGTAVALSPADKCEVAKLKHAARYRSCRLKAEAKAVKTGNPPDHAKCDMKFREEWAQAEIKAGGACPTNGDGGSMQGRITDAVNAIVTCLNSACPFTPKFPATGQTSCWNSSGVVIPCTGTGHDGELRAGAPLAYVDNGDGTIRDLNTGLMWEKKSDDGSIHDKDNPYNWDDAFAVHVAGLNSGSFAGYSDWRVPNAKELQSIVRHMPPPTVHPIFNTACVPSCTVLTCSCTKTRYWSSTSTGPGVYDDAFYVIVPSGNLSVEVKIQTADVRAVRGGS